ncbi:MAG: Gfo/Idh/MocA family oxidoreductase [Anaerolineae bacterium]
MENPVRWGVMGCANIATSRVLPAMLQTDKAELWAVASRTLEKAENVAEEFGAREAYGSYEDLLDDPEVEVVYIPLPNHIHKRWSIAALRAGIHVLCEKPIALDAEEAREMQEVAKANDRFLLEAFMYRFSPVVTRAIELVRDGALGDLRAMHSTFSFVIEDDPTNIRLQPETGGGALYDVGCYCINVLRMMAGREPTQAWATLSWSEEHEVDMGGVGMLDFGADLYGTFDTGFNASGDNYLRVVGTEGVMELPDGVLGRGEEAMIHLSTDDEEEIVVPLVDAYMLELEDMCDAVRRVSAPKFGDEPLDANMRVIDACYVSDASGFGEQL